MANTEKYEKTESGVLVPKGVATVAHSQSPATATQTVIIKEKGGWKAHLINGLSILIQLVTVVVLWWTFKKTVIPIQQKELLAEQAARLERENKQATQDIESARVKVAGLDRILAAQRQELVVLAAQRDTLKQDSAQALSAANASKISELDARAKESAALRLEADARNGLVTAQWSIFSNSAAWLVTRDVYQFNRLVREANRAGTREYTSPQDEVNAIIERAKENWPDYPVLVTKIAAELRQLRSPYFTPAMAREYADVFEKEGRAFRCVTPDFVAMKRRYSTKLIEGSREAVEKTRSERRRITKEYKAKGWTAEFDKDWDRDQSETYERMNNIGTVAGLQNELFDLPKECRDRFVQIGRSFLRTKAKEITLTGEELDY